MRVTAAEQAGDGSGRATLKALIDAWLSKELGTDVQAMACWLAIGDEAARQEASPASSTTSG